MRVKVHSRRRVLDGFFKVDEVKLQYEKFDGSMTPVITRLNFERGDSVAAVVLNTDTKKIIHLRLLNSKLHVKLYGETN